jgi:hypothetical protein
MLGGFPTSAASGLQLNIKVSNATGKSQTCNAVLHIEPSLRIQARDRVVLAYLEMSVSPDIVLDESWYDSFQELAAKVLLPRAVQGTETADSEPPHSAHHW